MTFMHWTDFTFNEININIILFFYFSDLLYLVQIYEHMFVYLIVCSSHHNNLICKEVEQTLRVSQNCSTVKFLQ